MKANKTRQKASNSQPVLCTCSACATNPDVGLQGKMIPTWRRPKHEKSDKMTPSLVAGRGKVKRQNPFRVQVAAQVASGSAVGQLSVPEAVTADRESPADTGLDQEVLYSPGTHSRTAVDTHQVDLKSGSFADVIDAMDTSETLNQAADGFDEHLSQRSPISSASCAPSPIPYILDDEALKGPPDQLEDEAWIYTMAPHPDDSDQDSRSDLGTALSTTSLPSPLIGGASLAGARAQFVPQATTFEGFHAAHEKWWIRIILMLVAFLHTKHHVSFRFSIFVSCSNCWTLLSTELMPVTEADALFEISWEARKRLKKCPTPKVVVPMAPLSTLISDFLMHEGMEKEVESWQNISSMPGTYSRVMDGAIWQSVVGHNGKHFFVPRHDEELHIGVTSSLDWYVSSLTRGLYFPSHSSGVFSFTVANLPTELKYQTENLLLATMTPGPHEPTAEELQNHLKFIVDDLLLLYDEGIIVQTPMFPQGRRVRIVSLNVIAQSISEGLGSGLDWTHQKNKKLISRNMELVGLNLHGSPTSTSFRMTIIDPMHNLLMGVLKNHWYGTWIQGKALRPGTAVKKRELDRVHGYLKDVGEPAGGALSADTYKDTVYLGRILNALASYEERSTTWERANGDAYQATLAAKHARKPSTKKSKREKKKIPDPPKVPSLRMHPGEDVLFLKLATAVKIYVQHVITKAEIARANALFLEYLVGYKKMYGEGGLKPNYHFSVHLPAQIRDYGPVYGFWCFLDECLNKLLKSFKSNNWGNGNLEVSMMRGWGRDVQIRDMASAFWF
ncbi:hypothetical protein K439DRAFT_1621346 [Ramaria rubella]|nr:hypothetical protein K439DRAFT_1621346 [Ramaria rubella]